MVENIKKNILSLDLGKGSLGLAISRSGMLVTPLPNLRFHMGDYDECIKMLLKTIEYERIEHIVIGLPLFPSGDPCEMTPVVEEFILKIQPLFPKCDIVKVDERYSTVEASEMLHLNNKKSKKQKAVIDSAAAMVILERYLKEIGQY
ncbi:MAG: Holliday junction resolvase RuvX [Bacillales bacterium]|nr:Holliday junction resolvase RuvX [Bacillales bacterium]